MRFKPYKHQRKEFNDHRRTKSRALVWQMRTGKTKAMVDLACYNYFAGYIDAVVVIAPNGVHENWIDRELKKHHWAEADYQAVSWSSRRVKKQAFRDALKELLTYKDGLAWLSLNEECFTVPLARAYLKRFMQRRKFLIIFDESQGFGAPGSKRTKAARAAAKRATMNRILSGTPVENSPLKAFSQYELLEKEALGFRTYEDFKDRYADYRKERTKGGREYPVLDGYKNLDELKARMAKYTSVVLREECDDMPRLVKTRRYYEPSEAQMSVYRQLFHQSMLEREDGTLTVFEGGTRGIKMQQALSSFYIDEDGDVEVFDQDNPRLDALMEEVELARPRGKFIIWARFRVEIEMIADRLRAAGISFYEYHGGVKDTDKKAARTNFLDPEDPVECFLGQTQAGGKGLDLSTARTVLRYSYSHNAEAERQAEERATQIGGVDIDLVDVVATNWTEDVPLLVDTHILNSLEDKSIIAEDLSRSGMQAYIFGMQV